MRSTLLSFSIIFLTLCFNSNAQTDVWVKKQSGSSVQTVQDITISESNGVYVAGTTLGTATFGNSVSAVGQSYDLYLVKYNEEGVAQWAQRGGGSGFQDKSNTVALDPFGAVYLGGSFGGSATFGNESLVSTAGRSAVITKFDTNGNSIWAVGQFSQTTSSAASVVDIHCDDSGNVYALTQFLDTVIVDTIQFESQSAAFFNGYNYLVTKYDSAGNLEWVKQIETNASYNFPSFSQFYKGHGGLVTDDSDDVYVAGNFQTSMSVGSSSLTSSGSYDAFLLKLTGDSGNVVWLNKGGGTGLDLASDITISEDQKLYMIGKCGSSALFGSVSLNPGSNGDFIVSYNTSGTALEGIATNNTSSVFVSRPSIVIDTGNSVVFSSTFNGSLTIDGQSYLSSGGDDPYGARYNFDSDSLEIFYTIEDGSSTFSAERAFAAAAFNDNSFVIGGSFNGIVDFGNNSENSTSTDGFIVRVADCSSLQAVASVSPASSICAGESATFTADTNSLYGYQWIYNGSILGGEINANYITSNAGNYAVLVDSAGCFDTSNVITLSVNPAPNVTHSNLSSVCDSEDPFQLTGGNPSGGTYTGTAVVNGDTFDPGIANLGTNNVTYVYTDTNGCADSVTKTIVVNQSPAIFTTTISACENDSPISLATAAYGFPAGGSHSGSGVVGTTFDPSLAGPGTHVIYYASSNGCQADDSITATVTAAPNASLSSIPNACISAAFVSLVTYGSPFGGAYSGTGVSSPFFFPAIAGVGTHDIIYSVTSSGCTATDTTTITVDSLPVATFSALPQFCEGDSNEILTGYVSPTGGSFSGTGIINDSIFSPNTSGTGNFTLTYSFNNACGTDTAQSIADVGESPSVSISSTNVNCNGGNDGSATATASGGSSPYSYAWSNSVNIAANTNLSAGTYTVTVTDANGCTEEASVTITEPTPLSVGTSATPASCNGGNDGAVSGFASGGTSPYDYLWSNGSTNAIVSNVSAGTYTVTVTDDNGCTVTGTATVTEPTAVVASISSSTNVSCNGDSDGSATAAGSGGTSPYTYSWNTGGTAATENGLSAGTYSVTVTDNNSCTDSTTITITEPTALTASTSINSNVSCFGGNDGSATATPAGGTSPYSYSWSSGGNAATENGLSAGTYTVTVTDNNSCTTTATATITEPATAVAASITSSTNVSCNGGSNGSATVAASGGTSPYTYSWSSGGTTTTENGLSAGTYTVTVTDNNSCTDTAQVTITEPAALIASTTVNNNVSCNGGNDGSATASASGGTSPYTYSWSSGGSAATEPGLSAGTYTVTITDNNSCTATATAIITEPTPVVASISSSTNVNCNGGNDGSATAAGSGGTSPYTYSWNTGGTAATENGLSAGTYSVTVTDNNSCTDSTTITITEPTALTASTSINSNVSCFGGNDGSATATPAGGTSPYSYSWSSGGNAATENGLSAGTYTVTVTDNNSCTTTATATITEPATAVAASITSSTNVSCNGGSNGSATVAASGGTSPYTYSWSSGGTTTTENGLSAGTYTVTVTDNNSCTDTAQVTITEPAALIASTTVNNNVSCNGGNDGSATASASGGTSPYTYSWSSGGSAATEPGLSAGTYTVTITDNNSCTATATAIITEPTPVVASISSSTNVNCNGGNDGSATAAGSGGTSPYTYSWNTGGTAATENGLSAGTYSVTVTDNNSCTDSTTITITEPTALTASTSINSNVSCFGGNDGSATATPAGGTSPYSYSWSSGGNAATENGLSAGTYTVTVTDNNSCTTTATATITEPATAVAASITSSTNVSCNGGSNGSATVAASGGTSPYTYSWSSGGTTTTENGLSAGTYTVTVTDNNSCTDTAQVTITEPAALIASTTVNNNVSCNGGNDGSATASASGGTSPYTYSWSSGGSAATEPGLSAGTYTVTITDNNSCTATATAIITEPTPVVASISSSTNVNCNGGNDGSATAAGSGGTSPYTYSWNTGGTAATENGLSAGTYSVTVTDNNSCTDSTTITITEPTALTASTSINSNVSCFGGNDGSATATPAGGTSPYSYSWSSGGNAATENGLSAGTYTVTVTDNNSCTTTATATITEPATAVAASITSSTNVSCNGGSNGSATVAASGGTSPYTYSWSSGGTTTTENGLSAGTYTVTVTDNNSCTDTAQVTITEPATLIASSTVNNNVNCNGGNDGSATASATGGTPVYSYSWNTGGTSATENGLSAGTYFVTITDNNGCTDSSTVSITEPTAVSVALTATNVSCFGAGDGSISSTATGGTSPYAYSWSNAATTASISSLTPGTYSVTVTDNNGCTDSSSVTITQPLNFSASTSGSNISCNGGNDGYAIASQSGGTSPFSYAWSNSGATDSIGGLVAGDYTVTITDNNGCTDESTITLTEPTSLAVTATVDSNTTCASSAVGVASASASGGTSPYAYAWSSGGSSFQETGLGTGTYTVTVTDNNGCTDTAMISIVVQDTVAPIAVAADTIIYLDLTGTDTLSGIDLGYASTDACGIDTMTLSQSIFNCSDLGLVLNVTLTVEDVNGNTSTDVATVMVMDTLAPVVLTHDTTVYLDASGQVTITPSYVDDGTFDNCSLASTTLSQTTFNCGDTGVTVLTFYAQDGEGNMDSSTVNVTVLDTIPPALLTQNITVYLDAFGSATITPLQVDNGSTDACGIDSIWLSDSTFSCADTTMMNTVTLYAQDVFGNIDSATALVTVIDSIAPQMTVNNATLYLDASGNATLQVSDVVSDSTENCAVANVDLSQSLFACADTGANSITVTITDVSGNTTTETVQIMVEDTVPPTVIAQNITVYLDATGNDTINAGMIDNGSNDNCQLSALWLSDSVFSCIDTVAPMIINLYGIDLSGNMDSATAVLNVVDTLAPALAAQNLTVYLDASGSAVISAGMVDNGSSDNCAIEALWLSDSVFSCADTAPVNAITMFGKDFSGNIDSITAQVTVFDTITPQMTTNNLTVYLDASGSANITVNDVVSDTTENCAVSSVTLSQSSFDCGDTVGVNSITITMTDVSGNSSTAMVNVTVLDTLAPVVNPFSLTTLYITSTGSVSITPLQIDSASSDNCAIDNLTLSQTVFDCADLGMNTIDLTAIDVSGNTSSASALVMVIDTITEINVSVDTALLCFGDTNAAATATATGISAGYSYLWSDGQTTAQATGLSSGTYYVTATSPGGCSIIDSVTFVEPTAISTSLMAQDITCNAGSDGFVTVSVSNGTPTYSYNWSNGGLIDSIGGLSAGAYTVTVTDANGCSVMEDTVLTQPAPFDISIVASDTSLCTGDTFGFVALTAITGNTSPYTFIWDVGFTATTDTVFNLGAGTYSITVTDTNGCIGDTSITIAEDTLPTVSFTIAEDTVCEGIEVSLSSVNPIGGTYFGAGVLSDTLFTEGLNGMQVINYSFTNANGCSASSQDSVFVLPQAEISFSADPIQLCAEEVVSLDFASPAGGVYTSPFVFGNVLIAPDTAYSGIGGVYTFQNTCGLDTDTFNINVTPNPVVDLGNDTSWCNANSFTLDAGSHASYFWSNGSQDSTFIVNGGEEPVLGTETYWVQVANDSGCTASDSITIELLDQPVFFLGENIYACLDSIIELEVEDVYDNFQWSTGESGTSIIAHDGTITPPGLYPYWVTGSNEAGCSYSDTIVIRLQDCDSVFVAVRNLANRSVSFEFFPNPAKDVLNARLNGIDPSQLERMTLVTNMGELVKSYGPADWTLTGSGDQVSISLDNLAGGMYLLQVQHAFGQSTARIVVGLR